MMRWVVFGGMEWMELRGRCYGGQIGRVAMVAVEGGGDEEWWMGRTGWEESERAGWIRIVRLRFGNSRAVWLCEEMMA